MRMKNAKSLTLTVLTAIIIILGFAQAAYANLESAEIILTARVLEPGAHVQMVDPNTIGDGLAVFEFSLSDVDPQANDMSDVEIDCFLVQSLGTATEMDIEDVMIIDSTQTAVAPPDEVGPPSDDAPAGSACDNGAAAGSNIGFEAFIDTGDPLVQGDGFIIADGGSETFQVLVLTHDTTDLQANGSQGKTVRVRVTVYYEESVGSPEVLTSFTLTISDSIQDTISNSGANDVTQLDFLPAPIAVGNEGVLIRFRICDEDANSHTLRINELVLVQGPMGSAIIDDFDSLSFVRVTGGANELWGQLNDGDAEFDSDFNRDGSGITLTVIGGFVIADDSCEEFEIRGETKMTAFKGRVIQLRVQISTQEPDGTDMDESTDEVLQSINTIMIGSGLIRIVDTQTPGGDVPIQISGFSSPGLGTILVQSRSVQYDPNVINVDRVSGVEPYFVDGVKIDNRNGILMFNIKLGPIQSGPAKLGIPLPETIANIQVIQTGNPGQRTTMVFQADIVTDENGVDLTDQVSIVSGVVLIPFFGDVDLNSDGATVKDVLSLADALMGCFLNPPMILELSDEAKKIGDVAFPFAPGESVPDCNYLSSADLVRIAQAAILNIASSSVQSASVATAGMEAEIRKPFYIRWLHKLFPWMAKAQSTETALVELKAIENSDNLKLEISHVHTEIGGLQGVIKFNPRELQVDAIRALDGYRMMASSIDNRIGEIRFLMLGQDGNAGLEDIFEIHASGHDPQISMNIQYLVDGYGNDISFEMVVAPGIRAQSIMAFSVESLELSSQGTLGWKLRVHGQNVSGVRVDAFDLGGTKRFVTETEGSLLRIRPQDMLGQQLANGVYLMVVTAKGPNGERWISEIRKVVVVR